MCVLHKSTFASQVHLLVLFLSPTACGCSRVVGVWSSVAALSVALSVHSFEDEGVVGYFSTDLDVVESIIRTGVVYTGYDLSCSYG